jgi:hypothetical protein
MMNTTNTELAPVKVGLTNTERIWRVSPDCQGMDLLNLKQRHEVHNLKTYGFTLYNVTPCGNALLLGHGCNGHTEAAVFQNGKTEYWHFSK